MERGRPHAERSNVDAYKAELAALLKRFGANVRSARKAEQPQCSQERLSDATRLHRTEIGRIEQGVVEPRLTTLMILAEGLGVTVDELLRDISAPLERKPAANGSSRR